MEDIRRQMDNTEQSGSRIRLKGVGDSLWVTLDPAQPLDEIRRELTKLFGRMGHLAANARVVIDTGDSRSPEDLIRPLERFLKESFSVASVTTPPRKRPAGEERIRKKDMDRSWQYQRSDVLMLSGRVRSGQKVTARKHLLILGDVNPGGQVAAGGDILVLGSLSGSAAAGQPDNTGSIVLALDFRPTQIQIGNIVAAGLPPAPEKTTEFARVENDEILVEDYLAVKPFSRLPWPEIR